MKETLLRIAGIVLAATAVYLFLSGILGTFTPFRSVVFPVSDSLASTEKGIAHGVSYSLWNHRSLDIIVLALLLFASSACCATILSPQRNARK